MLTIFNSLEYRNNKSRSVNASYRKRPERREAMIKWMNALNSNPEVIRKRATTRRKMFADPEVRRRHSECMKAWHRRRQRRS